MPPSAATMMPSLCGMAKHATASTEATSAAAVCERCFRFGTMIPMKVSGRKKSSGQSRGTCAPTSTPASVETCQLAQSAKPAPK
jgi:hypothetical protein